MPTKKKPAAKKPGLRVRRVPKKQIENPTELHPTKDGLLRVTPENAPLTSVMLLQQIRDVLIKVERKLDGGPK